MSEKIKRKSVNQEVLMEAFHFNRADLLANHDGKLSKRQPRPSVPSFTTVPQYKKGLDKFIAVMGFAGAPVLIIISIFSQEWGIAAIGILAFIGCFKMLVAEDEDVQLLRKYPGLAKPRKPSMRVGKVEGNAKIEYDKKGNIPQGAFLTVGSRAFTLSLEEVRVLEQGGFYRIYFRPESNKILSIEQLI